jgi:ABC-type lipoprotein export system ATPase subunit
MAGSAAQGTAGVVDAGTPTIVGSGLVKVYGEGDAATTALAGVDVEVRPGRMLAILGPSGSGKSTLMHLMAGIDSPTEGFVEVGGRRLDELSDIASAELRATEFGFVLQRDNLIPALSVRENVAAPLLLAGVKRDEAMERADALLERVGIAARAEALPNEISGGEAQRAAVARACVGRPSVIFADEPTGALDRARGDEVIVLLREMLSETGAAAVVVTHDAKVAEQADETLRLVDGHVADAGS